MYREQDFYNTTKSAELLCSTGSQVEKKGAGVVSLVLYQKRCKQ